MSTAFWEERLETHPARRRTVVVLAVGSAVGVNLVIYFLGRAFGADFEFTQGDQRAQVDAVTVAGFTAVPLTIGLLVVACLAPRWRWVAPLATVLAPSVAIITVGVMTVPADFDTLSTLCLAACHLALAPISVTAVRWLDRLSP